MSQSLAELFTISTSLPGTDWSAVVTHSHCKYLSRKCLKIRKSDPSKSIGTCSVNSGEDDPIVICPHRLLEHRQIFLDCIHLLTMHQPGNRLHIVSEISIPGGSVDYFLVSEEGGKVRDFVGIELQTLDTTGTVWPIRQRFLLEQGLKVAAKDTKSPKGFGMNWKMTAKTTLVQLHHKVETFEYLNKKLVIVIQDKLLNYVRREFSFDHIRGNRLGDSMHFHAYTLARGAHNRYELKLNERISTDSAGVSKAMGLQAEAKIEMSQILEQLEAKISESTLLKIFPEATEEVAT
jgi:hypothetical protein